MSVLLSASSFAFAFMLFFHCTDKNPSEELAHTSHNLVRTNRTLLCTHIILSYYGIVIVWPVRELKIGITICRGII